MISPLIVDFTGRVIERIVSAVSLSQYIVATRDNIVQLWQDGVTSVCPSYQIDLESVAPKKRATSHILAKLTQSSTESSKASSDGFVGANNVERRNLRRQRAEQKRAMGDEPVVRLLDVAHVPGLDYLAVSFVDHSVRLYVFITRVAFLLSRDGVSRDDVQP